MPHKRLKKQYTKFSNYFKSNDMQQSLKAMDLVEKYHVGERRGGGPERSHLYEVAGQILTTFEAHVDLIELDSLVAAGFLHDLVEDYADLYSESDLRRDFSSRCADLVMNVCKWDGFQKIEEDYIAYFDIVSSDIGSVVVKTSDRIHNMSTCIGGMSPARIRKYIEEVRTYFFPMIRQARKDYPLFYMALTGMKQQLDYRIDITEAYLDLMEENKQLKKDRKELIEKYC